MKTAVDLPDELFRELKLRAAGQGRKLKDVIAEVLRLGLDAKAETKTGAAKIGRDQRTGLPVVECRRPAAPESEVTPNRVAEILLGQEIEWQREAGR